MICPETFSLMSSFQSRTSLLRNLPMVNSFIIVFVTSNSLAIESLRGPESESSSSSGKTGRVIASRSKKVRNSARSRLVAMTMPALSMSKAF